MPPSHLPMFLCALVMGCHASPDHLAAAEATTKPSAYPAAPTGPSTPPPPTTVAEVASETPPSRSEPDAARASFELRCGWIDNPTLANWSLADRDGEWEIGVQGGYQAAGEMPDFGSRWVETNVHYGYGCACMSAMVDKAKKRVLEYRQVKILPLDRCKKDERLLRR